MKKYKLLLASAAIALASVAGRSEAYDFNDSHFHLTNYIQEGLTLPQFLQIMGDRTGRAAVFGIPLSPQPPTTATHAELAHGTEFGLNFAWAPQFYACYLLGTCNETLGDLSAVLAPQNYTVNVMLPSGMHGVGATRTSVTNATSLSTGTTTVSYSVSTGWAADQAVPIASVLFAAAFIVLALKRPESEGKEEDEEEETRVVDMLPDLIKGLEDKIALFSQFQITVAGKAQGAVSRVEFNKIRNEIDALKTRSINRLNEIKQTAGSKRFLELLNQIQDAEREEDRAAKDLLNLYDQYHSRRMREDTFRRLLPNYRKRWDAAANRLSDYLNQAQEEAKQA